MAEELQTCEHCSKDSPLETMTMMEDCWFCQPCVADFQKHFDNCKHSWEPYTNSMGEEGQHCSHCTGFVRNEDLHLIKY
jgi:hypothetical protein